MRHRSTSALSKVNRALERNLHARDEVRPDRRARFVPSPNDSLREKNRTLSRLRPQLPAECRLANFLTIRPPAPWCSPLPPVFQRAAAISLLTITPRRCRLCSVPAIAPRFYNPRYCKRPSRDIPHLRLDPDLLA